MSAIVIIVVVVVFGAMAAMSAIGTANAEQDILVAHGKVAIEQQTTQIHCHDSHRINPTTGKCELCPIGYQRSPHLATRCVLCKNLMSCSLCNFNEYRHPTRGCVPSWQHPWMSGSGRHVSRLGFGNTMPEITTCGDFKIGRTHSPTWTQRVYWISKCNNNDNIPAYLLSNDDPRQWYLDNVISPYIMHNNTFISWNSPLSVFNCDSVNMIDHDLDPLTPCIYPDR